MATKKELVNEVETNEVLTQNNEVKEVETPVASETPAPEQPEQPEQLSEMEMKAKEEAEAFMAALQVEFQKNFEASMKALEEKQRKEKEAFETTMKQRLMQQAAIELKRKQEEEARKKLVETLTALTESFLNENIEKFGNMAGAIIRTAINNKVTAVSYTTTKRRGENTEGAKETNKAVSSMKNPVYENFATYELIGEYCYNNGFTKEEAEELFTKAYNSNGQFDQHFIHSKAVEYLRRGKERVERRNSLNNF